MQLTDFKLLKEDDDAYHLSHPTGRKMVLGKKGLSEKAHVAIKGLPHFDEGGEVDAASPDRAPAGSAWDALVSGVSGIPGAVSGAVDSFKKGAAPAVDKAAELEAKFNLGNVLPTPVPGQLSPVASSPALASVEPVAAPVAEAPAAMARPAAPAAAADPFAQNRQASEDLINRSEQDVRDYMKSMDAAGKGSAQAYGDYADKLADMQTPQEIVQSYKAKDDALVKAIAGNEIDPERYWHNKTTGSKVLAGIGVILGGMGAHATGGRNLALEQINNAIGRDMEAQKASQDKKLSLWKMNRAAMDTDLHANLATQNQLLSLAQAKTVIAQGNASSAGAKLRAGELITQLEQQKNENRLKLALLSQGAGAGGRPSTMDPAMLVQHLVPQAHQKEVFTEIKQAQNAATNEKPLMENFERATSENSVLGRAGRLGFVPPSIKSLNALADPLIHDNEGRINELEQQHVQGLFPQPGDTAKTVQTKREALQAFINQKKAAPTAKGFGINLENFQSTTSDPRGALSPQQAQYFEWAKANPQDPRAAMVLKKLGVR